MQRHLTLTELKRFAGKHARLSTEEKYKLVDELVQRHTHGLHFGEYKHRVSKTPSGSQ